MSMGELADFDIRRLLIEVGGPRRPEEPLSFYFNRVARKVGISARCARAAWNREITHPYSKTAIRLREARERDQSAKVGKFASLFDACSELLEARGGEADRELVSTLSRLAGRLRDLVPETEIKGSANDECRISPLQVEPDRRTNNHSLRSRPPPVRNMQDDGH